MATATKSITRVQTSPDGKNKITTYSDKTTSFEGATSSGGRGAGVQVQTNPNTGRALMPNLQPTQQFSNIIEGQSMGLTDPINKKLDFAQKNILQDYTGMIPGMTTPNDNTQTLEQQKKDSNDKILEIFKSSLNADANNPVPSGVDSYNKAQQQSGILQAQQNVSNLTGQLNQIVATGQQNQQMVVGQGRGIPSAIIGGQQAEMARETAIQSLPVSAQLNAAQGNLEMAQSNLNTLFKIYSDDATNAYNAKSKRNEAIFTFLTDQEKAKLASIQKQEDRAYAEQLNARDANNTIAIEVSKNGKGTPAMYDSLAKATTVAEGIKIAGSALQTQTNDIVKLGNGNTVLIDKFTGEIIKNLGGAAPNENNIPQKNSFFFTKDSIDTLHNGDIVKVIANTIKTTGAKQTQSTNDAINVIAGVQLLVDENQNGKFSGLGPMQVGDYFSTAKQIGQRGSIGALNLKVQQWASGASLTTQQIEQVEKITPKILDTDKQVRSKVNSLANYMVTQVRGQLAGQGIDFSMEPVDLFNKKPANQDPLQINTSPTVGGQDSLNLFK